jgi:hypothetical protein
MKMIIPEPLKLEHKELHRALGEAVKTFGPIGKAAEAVAKVLHPHFKKEEEYALPPIGLLKVLAKGKIPKDMEDALNMTKKLKKDLPHILKEHKAIIVKLKKLVTVAKKEKRPEFAHFAEKLILHARTEEEVIYPAAILIGEYLKEKLALRKLQ